jgi:hypothetical protein
MRRLSKEEAPADCRSALVDKLVAFQVRLSNRCVSPSISVTPA